jgi:precorrin-4/cobalt-precorrin-4 C11-methyltransferase
VALGVQAIEELVAEVEPHYGADCPVAVVAWASWPQELILRGTLATIARQVCEADVKRTAVIIVGPVLAGEDRGASHLYSKGRERVGS